MAIEEAGQTRTWKIYGLIIIIGSLAALGGMAVHPTGGGKVMDTVRDLAANGGFNALVHGFLIGVYLLLILGFWGFSDWLGSDRPAVRGGIVAYAAGAFAGVAGAIQSGFVGRTLAFNYLDAKPEEINSVVAAFRVSGAQNFAWGRMWMIAISAAFLLWSIELVRRDGSAKYLGGFGVIIGIVGFIGIPSGLIPLTVVALVGLILAQTAWSIGAGLLMIRSR
jgi:hypothetical protein